MAELKPARFAECLPVYGSTNIPAATLTTSLWFGTKAGVCLTM